MKNEKILEKSPVDLKMQESPEEFPPIGLIAWPTFLQEILPRKLCLFFRFSAAWKMGQDRRKQAGEDVRTMIFLSGPRVDDSFYFYVSLKRRISPAASEGKVISTGGR